MTELHAGSATDVGLVRTINQDQRLVAPPLYAIADGMGGHAAGEVAASIAVRALEEAFTAAGSPTPEALADAARAANQAVWKASVADRELRGMGTTLVAIALVAKDSSEALAAINIGDSRLYRLRGDNLEQLTADHSLVAEMVAEGQILEEEAEFHPHRNVLTRALGVDPDVEVDLVTETIEPGDRFVLCSDGLYREVNDELIAAVLRRLADPADAARELVAEAKMRGGSDNITVIVVNVPPVAEPPSDTEEKAATGVVDEAATGTEAAPARPARRWWRRRGRPARTRMVTVRVVAFFVVLLIVLGAGAAAIAWYGRSSYFVGLQGNELTIFQGRPGGVLWMQPTIKERTGVTTDQVESQRLPALRAGQTESSVQSARQYITRLRTEYQQATLGTPST
ncbi:MAG: Stp1/IreP family PP2C-type Ser/Thr phosphatase [Acidimicrobiaceae bacterium]|nr:Stp1/IreP family PP2C-type Ser/Thr phosphatase [Acidimicrobiaceae bacterium]